MTSKVIRSLLKQTLNVVPVNGAATGERKIQLYHNKNGAANVTVLYIPGMYITHFVYTQFWTTFKNQLILF